MGMKNVSIHVWIPVLLMLFSSTVYAQDSLCAKVKIEIKQELTIERQAFDAHMRINNGLTHSSLENIKVEVWFTDEDENVVLASSESAESDALFFIRVDRMTNIDDVSGTGSVAPDSSADIHWLIIPTLGASNGLESGTLYYVGATLTYTVGGEENTIEVNPDYIFVKPLPNLTLDYFLPEDVYGDDPSTDEIEPSAPFSLGVRVNNSGHGAAKDLKINSAQPEIRTGSNNQGLLINFNIQGTEVNGVEIPDSLLLDFGTIEPGKTAIGRWLMTCSLSGTFVSFDATYTHSDELGGELTSVIEETNPHILVQDVLVDLPGRDDIRDFLSKSDDTFMVYESDSGITQATDQSSLSSLTHLESSALESTYSLEIPVTAGFAYVRLPDPLNGDMILKKATRSDGKEINPANCWLSKTQDRTTQTWDHFVNLFDVNTTDSYTLVFADASTMPQPPAMQYIAEKSARESQQVSFIVEASDPNGTIPALSASPLPVGAVFTDSSDGTGIFDWTPSVGQKGTYYITFSASDGSLSTSRRVKFIIYDIGDTDMDGMLDEWEMTHFGTLVRDGAGDFDGDGIADLQEFLDQTDPTTTESAPSEPEPVYPHPNVDVEEAEPELVVENSSDAQDDEVDYEFEIYSDEAMTDEIASDDDVAQMFNQPPDTFGMWLYSLVVDNGQTPVSQVETTTNWRVPVTLPDNKTYYWRVRSSDNKGSSLWAYQHFFVNTQNDPPSAFNTASPGNNTQVDSLTPVLSILNSKDIDNDIITYSFEVYEDEAMTLPVASATDIAQGNGSTSWTVSTQLSDQTSYYWRAIAVDDEGAQTAGTLQTFSVNTSNTGPTTPTINSPDGQTEIETYTTMLEVGNSTDPDGNPISYYFEIDTSKTFNSPDKQVSGEIHEGNGTTWWQVANLLENTKYYWRVKASDGSAQSVWANSQFFVNIINDGPSVPTLKNPGSNAWVDTRTPVLSVHPASDPDHDTIEYRFEVYTNPELTRFVIQGNSSEPDWTFPSNLTNNIRYYWRAQAIDEHGVPSPWTPVTDFFVNVDLVNDPPVIEIIEPFEDLYTNTSTIEIKWTDSDPDSSAIISLYYDTDNQGQDGTLIIENIEEDQDNQQDLYTWDVSSIEDGIFYIYAVISDEDTEVCHYAPVQVRIDRTPPEISITPPGGDYSDTISVNITSNETSEIYYTLDGSEPDTGSARYTEPLEISDTTVLKCMAIDPAGNSTSVISNTYDFTDTDEDGITDNSEINKYGTDPEAADTDGDGINDGDEVAYWGNNWNADPDNDGLINILDSDADGDGVLDGDELKHNSDPNDPASYPAPKVYEDAEDSETTGWEIYDNMPPFAQISNLFDELRQSRVIELQGFAAFNGYRLYNADGNDWNDTEYKIIEWNMNPGSYFDSWSCPDSDWFADADLNFSHTWSFDYSRYFIVYVAVQTSQGLRYLYYTPSDTDDLGTGTYIHHGLGKRTASCKWRTFIRDLEADLKDAQPDNELEAVLGFLVRGDCRLDDIKTHIAVPVDKDSDQDGITDKEEIYTYGTRSYIEDTDQDGIKDGDELAHWGEDWNSDPDSDGIINILDPDADNDGFTDGIELKYGSDPGDFESNPISIFFTHPGHDLFNWEGTDGDCTIWKTDHYNNTMTNF